MTKEVAVGSEDEAIESSRPGRFRRAVSSVLGVALALCATPASAKLVWTAVAAPGPVNSVVVASHDIPVVATGGKVFYMGWGKGACTGVPRLCANKWIEIPGANTSQLSMGALGVPEAIDARSGKVMSAVPNTPNANDNYIPGKWVVMGGWRPGCVSSFAVTDPGNGDLGFVLKQNFYTAWAANLYAVGCSSAADSPLWVLQRSWTQAKGFKSSAWKQLDARHGAISSKVALFRYFSPVGPSEEVWFMDSYESGGRTFLYDTGRDVLVERLNPPRISAKPNPPRTQGTAITDHYARFASPGVAVGKTYRWDDDTEAWVFVLNDPTGAEIQNLAYASAYESSAGTYGPSRLWANDTAGNLYVAYDSATPK